MASPPHPPLEKLPLKRLIPLAGVLVAVLASVLLLAACGSAPSSNAPGQPTNHTTTTAPTPTPAPPPPSCSPEPCAFDGGGNLAAGLANDNLPPGQFDSIPAGAYLVQVTVDLKVEGNAPLALNPFDFKLQTPAGVQVSEAFSEDPQCSSWQAVTVVPGGDSGPQNLCFTPTGNPGDKLILVWQPESLFNSPASIPLN